MNNDAYIERVRKKSGGFLERHEPDIEINVDIAGIRFIETKVPSPVTAIIVLAVNALLFGLPIYFLLKSCSA